MLLAINVAELYVQIIKSNNNNNNINLDALSSILNLADIKALGHRESKQGGGEKKPGFLIRFDPILRSLLRLIGSFSWELLVAPQLILIKIFRVIMQVSLLLVELYSNCTSYYYFFHLALLKATAIVVKAKQLLFLSLASTEFINSDIVLPL